MRGGDVMYHNGTNWNIVSTGTNFSDMRVADMYYSGNELFVFLSNGEMSFVLHGK
jgi:hypothetical protein